MPVLPQGGAVGAKVVRKCREEVAQLAQAAAWSARVSTGERQLGDKAFCAGLLTRKITEQARRGNLFKYHERLREGWFE